MKTDAEFLSGVYKKADELNALKANQPEKIIDISSTIHKKNSISKIAFSLSGFAAVICIVVSISANMSTPMFVQNQQADSGIDNRSIEIDSFASPIAISGEGSAENTSPISIAQQADAVVVAEVKKIDKSVYEKDKDKGIITAVTLKEINSIKGELNGKFKLIVNGGYIKKTQSFTPYQAYFEKGESVLLFLNKIEDEYVLSTEQDSKYAYCNDENGDSVYSSENGNTISMAELINSFS